MGCTVFVHAETSNAIHGDKTKALSATPRLDAEGWKEFGARLTKVADYIPPKASSSPTTTIWAPSSSGPRTWRPSWPIPARRWA
jgi:hypothetical protein